MPKLKPKMFIGSSSEAIERQIPQRFRDNLVEFVDATLWTQARQFDTGNSTMAALFEAANEYDFALLVLTPDDEVTSRDKSRAAPRDNIIFELVGIFEHFAGEIGLGFGQRPLEVRNRLARALVQTAVELHRQHAA